MSAIESKEVLETILARDPFHKNGIADYDITEFIFSMVAPGFEVFKDL